MDFGINFVRERDIDLLLVQKLGESAGFRDWFLQKIGYADFDYDVVESVDCSVYTANGESDVELRLRSGDLRLVVLIEDKINAVLQEDQDHRYNDRAALYEGESVTVLVAPRNYHAGKELSFERRVDYEDMLAWFDKHTPNTYASALLRAALIPTQPVPDKDVTDFWGKYWQLTQEFAPALQMNDPGSRPAGAGFVYFHQADTPPGTVLVHKFPHGNFDVQLAGKGKHVDFLKNALSSMLPTGMSVDRAGKSAVIRCEVRPLNTTLEFEKQINEVRDALLVARNLLAWVNSDNVRAVFESLDERD
jgi:hypothetical protein